MDKVTSLQETKSDKETTHDSILIALVDKPDGTRVRLDILKDNETREIAIGLSIIEDEESDYAPGETITLCGDCDDFVFDKLNEFLGNSEQ
jgi:hypothetical protein